MKALNSEKVFLIVALTAILMAAFSLYWVVRPQRTEPPEEVILEREEDGIEVPVEIEHEPTEDDRVDGSARIVVQDVPFTAQAPFGEWSDPRQQDGCEEAASLMAVFWARGATFTLAEAKAEIIAITEYEQTMHGTYRDTSASDTLARIIRGYFGFDGGRVETGITKQDMIDELYGGNVLIVPANGKALYNPNFTAGGPDRHMLVVIGYDPDDRVFITNENGTRQGEGYRYDEDLFFNAVRDYPSGSHEPIMGVSKVMVVVAPVE